MDYPELRTVLYQLLFTGKPIPYVQQNQYIEIAAMFGLVKDENGSAVISNRIFESLLYNLFISEEFVTSKMYDAGLQEKSQFIINGVDNSYVEAEIRNRERMDLNKGYMLSFNFNKKKEIGVREIVLGDKLLIEAVV